MARRRFAACLLLTCLVAGRPAACRASVAADELLSVAVLLESGAWLDGRPVLVRGEAIGDLMVRGAAGWVNIHDGTGAVGVYARADQLRLVEHLGRHNVIGDLVEVRGLFCNGCAEHGGGAHIHARDLSVVGAGGARAETFSRGKFFLANGLLLLALLTLVCRQFYRRRAPVS